MSAIRDPRVLSEIERRSLSLMSETAGKLTVVYDWKDKKLTLANVSVSYPYPRWLTGR